MKKKKKVSSVHGREEVVRPWRFYTSPSHLPSEQPDPPAPRQSEQRRSFSNGRPWCPEGVSERESESERGSGKASQSKGRKKASWSNEEAEEAHWNRFPTAEPSLSLWSRHPTTRFKTQIRQISRPCNSRTSPSAPPQASPYWARRKYVPDFDREEQVSMYVQYFTS